MKLRNSVWLQKEKLQLNVDQLENLPQQLQREKLLEKLQQEKYQDSLKEQILLFRHKPVSETL